MIWEEREEARGPLLGFSGGIRGCGMGGGLESPVVGLLLPWPHG